MDRQEIEKRLSGDLKKFWDGIENPDDVFGSIVDKYKDLDIPLPKHKPQDHPEDLLKQWYKEYKKLGGKDSYDNFIKNQKKFEELTFNAYINGYTLYGTRAESWSKWVEFIGSEKSASLYFAAIDAITPYT